jgi:hypothetical protein
MLAQVRDDAPLLIHVDRKVSRLAPMVTPEDSAEFEPEVPGDLAHDGELVARLTRDLLEGLGPSAHTPKGETDSLAKHRHVRAA